MAAGLVALVAVLGAPPSPSTAPNPSNDGPAGALERGVVVRVADGDTVTVELDGRRERVRYVGVDAPEVAHPDAGSPAECGADAATRANIDLVMGVELTLESDATDRDRFGRLLRHPWIVKDGEWVHVGEALVASGLIEARTFPPDTRHQARLDAAERAARAAGAGVWSGC